MSTTPTRTAPDPASPATGRRSRTRIGFLSFGHYGPGAPVATAAQMLASTIELAEAAEAVGFDAAYVRVHHFARQQASPFPVLAAMGARTRRVELGTGVIDMRYEAPLAMAESAAQADLISGGRLHLGVSRGSPEPALGGPALFGRVPAPGESEEDMARRSVLEYRRAVSGAGVAPSDPAMGARGLLPVQPQSPGLDRRLSWGAGSRATAVWAGQQGLGLMSSTLLTEDTGVPLDELQAEQIALYREAFAAAGHQHAPRVSVSRSVIPITSDLDEHFFGRERWSRDQVGRLAGMDAVSRFGRSYAGDPDVVADELSRDAAVREADLLLITIPNALGTDYNAHLMASITEHVAPAIGWQRPA